MNVANLNLKNKKQNENGWQIKSINKWMIKSGS
jgi:hypothetical protein